jgi:hypothetical protein
MDQSPYLGFDRSTQNQGSFPPPALPGFSGTMNPSDARSGRLPAEPLRISDSLASAGLPCCDALCVDVPPPLPRRVVRTLDDCTPPDTAAFPALWPGRHSHLLFRGLLRVHSRCGPPICSPPYEDSCPGGSTIPVTRRPPARSYEAESSIASAGLPPARTRHLSRRTITQQR